MKPASPTTRGVALLVSPSGLPRVASASDPHGNSVDAARGTAIAAAFERGAGFGVLHLGAVEVGTEASARLALNWRGVGLLPGDDPALATPSGYGLNLRLERGGAGDARPR